MQAEIGYFSQMSFKPVKLGQIINASTPEQAAKLIHEVLPVSYATRVKVLGDVQEYADIPEVAEVKEILTQSFRNLRLVSQETNLDPLVEVIVDLRLRHKPIVTMLSVAAQKLKDLGHMTSQEANAWMDDFLLARVGTEMLTKHFFDGHQQEMQGSDRDQAGRSPFRTGIVDRRCDPGQIAQQAVENVKKLRFHDTMNFEVHAHACSASQEKIEFSFAPQYLQYMLEEILKNSAKAAAVRKESLSEQGTVDPSVDTIRVVVGADLRQVRIQISDKGGGIPSAHQLEAFSYSWSTKDFEPRVKEVEASPLAGRGMGLPMTRLYAEYLGGKLELFSLPGRGVDVFLDLMRIDP